MKINDDFVISWWESLWLDPDYDMATGRRRDYDDEEEDDGYGD